MKWKPSLKNSVLTVGCLGFGLGAFAQGLTERQFRQIPRRIAQLYAEDASAHRARIKIEYYWNSNQLNAGGAIRREGGVSYWEIFLHGELARHTSMTPDAFAIVVCHELGHSVGGAPIHTHMGATAEAQADYFATLKCFRRYARAHRERLTLPVLPQVLADCQKSFRHSEDRSTCQRSAIAATQLAAILNEIFTPGAVSPSVTTPDTSIATGTNLEYPAPQCRLDTMYQGALCTADERVGMSLENEEIGTCHPKNGDQIGNRPACWYQSQESM